VKGGLVRPISTSLFEFTTPAGPDAVWAAVTTPRLTPRFFFGLLADSTWKPGARVLFRPTSRSAAKAALRGEVLRAETPVVLSYSLDAGDGQPATYVTWQIAPTGAGGSYVRLLVDEAETGGEDDDEASAAWHCVVARLQGLLADVPLADGR
jgi:uncharacterized protein YndB with AHSA1/START domain